MALVTFYNSGTGEIEGIISCSDSALSANVSGRSYVNGGYDAETYYISGTTPTLRPSFSLSLSKSTMTADNTDYIDLVGVPSGATVTLSRVGASKTITADGTTIQIKTPLPGEYTVTVEKFPYRNGVVNFVATAST